MLAQNVALNIKLQLTVKKNTIKNKNNFVVQTYA